LRNDDQTWNVKDILWKDRVNWKYISASEKKYRARRELRRFMTTGRIGSGLFRAAYTLVPFPGNARAPQQSRSAKWNYYTLIMQYLITSGVTASCKGFGSGPPGPRLLLRTENVLAHVHPPLPYCGDSIGGCSHFGLILPVEQWDHVFREKMCSPSECPIR
jgi:hypothetical protein